MNGCVENFNGDNWIEICKLSSPSIGSANHCGLFLFTISSPNASNNRCGMVALDYYNHLKPISGDCSYVGIKNSERIVDNITFHDTTFCVHAIDDRCFISWEFLAPFGHTCAPLNGELNTPSMVCGARSNNYSDIAKEFTINFQNISQVGFLFLSEETSLTANSVWFIYHTGTGTSLTKIGGDSKLVPTVAENTNLTCKITTNYNVRSRWILT